MSFPFKPLAISGLACAFALAVLSCSQIAKEPATRPISAEPAGPKLNVPWDWTGIIGTGQSLAVGQGGNPVLSDNQLFNNLQLDTGELQWPVDPNNPAIKVKTLVEPIGRRATRGGGWPINIAGETPHTSMGNQISAIMLTYFMSDYVTVHTNVGENGQGMVRIRKNPIPQGTTGRAFEASLIETKAIARIAKEYGKTYGVAAIVVTHGESDQRDPQYDELLHQLWRDYNTDIPAITGQKEKILMIVSQQNGYNNSPSTVAQWRAGVKYPDDIVCPGPKYQYPSPDALHLTTEGYQLLGEKYAQVYAERVILGSKWRPLEPTGITRNGKTISVKFHVPAAPMVWDTEMENPHDTIAEWRNGKGFEVTNAAGQRVMIDSVTIKDDSVEIACGADPGANVRVSYALSGESTMAKPHPGFGRWGLLKDSDPFTGLSTRRNQPNYAVAFEMTAQ